MGNCDAHALEASPLASLPYNMIPPTKWPVPVPALSQPHAPQQARSSPEAHTGQEEGCGRKVAAGVVGVKRCRSASASPTTALPSFPSQPHLRSQSPEAPAMDTAVSAAIGKPEMKEQLQLVHDHAGSQHNILPGKASEQQLAGLVTVCSDVVSGNSLPIPNTPAAGEELRGRLHHSFSLTQSEQQQQQQQRPGSSGSEEVGRPHTSQALADHLNSSRWDFSTMCAASCEEHSHKRGKPDGTADSPSGLMAVTKPGLGALGRWAVHAVARNVAGLEHLEARASAPAPAPAPADGAASCAAAASSKPGHVEGLRCSSAEALPDPVQGPQAIEAAGQ